MEYLPGDPFGVRRIVNAFRSLEAYLFERVKRTLSAKSLDAAHDSAGEQNTSAVTDGDLEAHSSSSSYVASFVLEMRRRTRLQTEGVLGASNRGNCPFRKQASTSGHFFTGTFLIRQIFHFSYFFSFLFCLFFLSLF